MKVIRTISELKDSMKVLRAGGAAALVPTMGYLHEGHASLIRKARSESKTVSMSIFVNPLQFNNPADLETYPVSEEADLELCRSLGVDLVFAPSRSEMFPEPPRLGMAMPSLTETLCGPRRPGHFEGVMVIVARLFHLFEPHKAFFGLKDYQQFSIIRQMVKDLDFPVEIIGCETVRESDGLAMSSRNANLKPEHREQAALIYRGFKLAEKAYRTGTRNPQDLAEIAMDVMLSGPDNKVEYVEIVHPLTLAKLDVIEGDFVIAAAMYCGAVRLIDNMTVRP